MGLKTEMRTIGYKTPPWELSTLGKVMLLLWTIITCTLPCQQSLWGVIEGAVVLFSQLFRMLQVSLLSTGDPRESLENLLQLFPIICSKCSMKLWYKAPRMDNMSTRPELMANSSEPSGVRVCGYWINQLGDISLNEGRVPASQPGSELCWTNDNPLLSQNLENYPDTTFSWDMHLWW